MQNILSNPLYIGTAAGILTSVSMLPQLVKIIKEKKAEAISIPMLLLLFAGIALWIYYGLMKKDLPIILTNSFSLLVNCAVIFFGLLYKNRNEIPVTNDESR
jgi:MtN3 and saliva related transmembrane protein